VGALVAAGMLVGAVAGYIYTADPPQKACDGRACDLGDPDDCPQACECSAETLTCVSPL
jgi:hypothetical protein